MESTSSTYLRYVGVVKESEDDVGQGVLAVLGVAGGQDLGQGVLQGITEDAVKRLVRAQDLVLRPLVVPQAADLSPQAVQVLQPQNILIIQGITTDRDS